MLKGEKVRRTSDIINKIRTGHTAAMVAVCLFASCTTGVTYHHYEHIAHDGWDKRDSVSFTVDTVRQGGEYMATLCLRNTPQYPYRNVSVRIVAEIRPSGRRFILRKDFCIVNENGTQTGDGINYYTNEVPVGLLGLCSGDTLIVKVGHNMRAETLHGIEDVGIKLEKR